jgi:hypothetical protein
VSEPTQTPDPYEQYASNDDWKLSKSSTDYAIKMKEVLVKLQDLLEQDVYECENALNLVRTAQDYLFYLEDNRRVIL